MSKYPEDESSIPTYGQIPWAQLGRDVQEAIYARRLDYEFKPNFYPGHQHPPALNFNSLARIVDKYRMPLLAARGVPIADWKIVVDEDVLIYVVHPNAAFERDEKVRREKWEGWTSGRWINHNGGGWTYHGMIGTVTHVAPMPPPPKETA